MFYNTNQMKYNFLLILILLAVVIVACSTSCRKDKLEGDVVDNAELAAQLVSDASDTLIVDNQKLVLETELYRDFFPGVPSSTRSNLQALVWVVNTDSTLITGRFSIVKLHVINKSEIWISEPEVRNDDNSHDYTYYAVSVNGPKWDTGITVDVVVEILDLNLNKNVYLIAKNQVIERDE